MTETAFFASYIRKTVDLVQQMEKTGVSFITVHGRTVEQRAQPVDNDAIRLLADSVNVPVVANGDIRTLQDAHTTQQATGVKGRHVGQTSVLLYQALFTSYTSYIM